MLIRKTMPCDIDAVLEIYKNARNFMREQGNPNQWKDEYPSRNDVLADIEEGVGHVVIDGEEIVGAFIFKIGEDETYTKIYNGSWKNNEPYGVIHRIAVKYNGRGIAGFCFDECYKIINNVKIDTHKDNLPMQRALRKFGFEYCGIIYLENGEERIAFQKTN